MLAFAVAAPLVVGAGYAQAATPAESAPVCSPGPDPVVCWTPGDGLRNIGSQSTGAGAGRVTFNPSSIERKIDRSSP